MPHHGTPYCFRKGCRCDDCRSAWKAYRRDYMRRTRKAKQTPAAHGTARCYWNGCRCKRCDRAGRVYHRVVQVYPSVSKAATVLTDPTHHAFWRLLGAIYGEPLTVEQAERVRYMAMGTNDLREAS